MPQVRIHLFDDNPALARAFAAALADWLDGRERACIALSGGSTPSLLFRELAAHYADRIDWSKVHLFWGDERCVPPDHEESNFGNARRLLLRHIDLPEEQVHRIRGEADPEAEAARYGKEVRAHVPAGPAGWPTFDLVLLGMGSDGHTASIFPHQRELLHADSIGAVATHPVSGQRRVTLTGRVINEAQRVAFLVTGAAKAERVHEILEHQDAGMLHPARYIHPRGDLSWWLDRSAAARLDPSVIGASDPLI